jgi:hypothetical protein
MSDHFRQKHFKTNVSLDTDEFLDKLIQNRQINEKQVLDYLL